MRAGGRLLQLQIAHIAVQTYELYSHNREETEHHKETTMSLQTRDNDDENSLLSFSRASMCSQLYYMQAGTLQYLATKVLATESIQEALLHVKELRQEEVSKCEADRIVLLITACEAGRPLNLPAVKNELLPVPVKTKSILAADVLTDHIECPQSNQRQETSSSSFKKRRKVTLLKNWSNFLSLSENKADLAHFVSEQLFCRRLTISKL